MKRVWQVLLLFGIALMVTIPAHAGLNLGGHLEGRLHSHPELKWEQNLQVYLDTSSAEAGFYASVDVGDNQGEINLGEAYLELFSATTDWRVGRQLIPWGVMDTNSPVDIINPIDTTASPVRPNRLEVPALRVQHYWGD